MSVRMDKDFFGKYWTNFLFLFFFFRLFVVLATRSFLKERWGKECVTFRDKKASLLWNLIKNRKKKKKEKECYGKKCSFFFVSLFKISC